MSDKKCPHRIFQGEDLTRVPTGDSYCTAVCRGRERDEYGQLGDYYRCDSDNHFECFWFKREKLEVAIVNYQQP